MGSSFGEILKISLFGESHGNAIGLVIDGLPSGIKIDYDFINKELEKRRSLSSISTSRRESDQVIFLSGIFNDYTTGSPLAFIIENHDIKPEDYVKGVIRPSHSDLSAYIKYNSFNDYRGGGHFSGRLTAPLIVLGAICKQMLENKNIHIATHIKSLYDINDRNFDLCNIDQDIKNLNNELFPVLDSQRSQQMISLIENIKNKGDSVGGILETIIVGLEPGLGEPFFNSFESKLSSLLFSIGGVKGISFGDGFAFSNKLGSEVSDGLKYINREISFNANHNGGINGGITNGNYVLFSCAIKPTPSIKLPQHSINISTKENIELELNGRHDPCIAHRIRCVIDALTSYCIVEFIMQKNAKKW